MRPPTRPIAAAVCTRRLPRPPRLLAAPVLLAALSVAPLLSPGASAQALGERRAEPPPNPLVITFENLMAGDSAHRAMARAGRPAASLMPGDEVRYQLRFTNTTPGPVRNVRFDNPVPPGLTFVPATARSARNDVAVEYSIDGGRTYATAPTIEVVELGQRTRKPAPPSMITDIRWTVRGGVAAGEQVVTEYRAAYGGAPRIKQGESP